MPRLALNKDITMEDLEEKYNFTIVTSDQDLEDSKRIDELWGWYCIRAYKSLGPYYSLVIENDNCPNEVKIIPEAGIPWRVGLSHQLSALYELIKDGVVVEYED